MNLQTVKSFVQYNATVDYTDYDVFDSSIYSDCQSVYAGDDGSLMLMGNAYQAACSSMHR
jgi:hypothetical protein